MVHLWIWIQESIVMKHEHTQQTMPKHTTAVHVPIRREKKKINLPTLVEIVKMEPQKPTHPTIEHQHTKNSNFEHI